MIKIITFKIHILLVYISINGLTYDFILGYQIVNSSLHRK